MRPATLGQVASFSLGFYILTEYYRCTFPQDTGRMWRSLQPLKQGRRHDSCPVRGIRQLPHRNSVEVEDKISIPQGKYNCST